MYNKMQCMYLYFRAQNRYHLHTWSLQVWTTFFWVLQMGSARRRGSSRVCTRIPRSDCQAQCNLPETRVPRADSQRPRLYPACPIVWNVPMILFGYQSTNAQGSLLHEEQFLFLRLQGPDKKCSYADGGRNSYTWNSEPYGVAAGRIFRGTWVQV